MNDSIEPNIDDEKDEYIDYWQRVWDSGQQLHQLGSHLQREGAEFIDLAKIALSIPKSGRVSVDNADLSQIPREILHSIENSIGGAASFSFPLTFPTSFTAGTIQYSAASTLASTVEHIISQNICSVEEIAPVYENLVHFNEKHRTREQVIQELKRLGFEKSIYGKQALNQFESAWVTHLEAPPTSSASLLSIRGALDLIVGRLIACIPKCKGDKQKIVCIGREAKFDIKTMDEFAQFQQQYDDIYSKLSSNDAKQGTFPREQESSLMFAVTDLLIAILRSLDETKFQL